MELEETKTSGGGTTTTTSEAMLRVEDNHSSPLAVAAAASAVPASPSSDRKKEDPATCRLRRGELVRVSEAGIQASKRLKDRDGALGRISRVVEDEENGELFDVEWILGGRMSNVPRLHLVRTTAQEEGMTEECNKRRRCRRESTDDDNNESNSVDQQQPQETSPQPAAAAPAKQSPQKKPKTRKGQTTKAAAKATAKVKATKAKASTAKGKAKAKAKTKTTAKTTKTVAKKKPVKKESSATDKTKAKPKPSTAAAAGAGKKRKRNEQQQPAANAAAAAGAAGTATAAASAAGSTTTEPFDLFQRHKREFERMLSRLEKIDKFGFFLDDAPDEFDEVYDEHGCYQPPTKTIAAASEEAATTVEEVVEGVALGEAVPQETKQECSNNNDANKDVLMTDAQPPTEEVDTTTTTTTKENAIAGKRKYNKKKKLEPTFPSHAPYNWKMIRRRMEHGRYTLDRERLEEEARFQVFSPTYYATLPRKERPARKFSRRNAAKADASVVNPRVLYKQGVDWDTFRDDVVAMCDAAMERQQEDDEDNNNDGGVVKEDEEDDGPSEGKGSLVYAVTKIKEAVLQTFERTGCRHATELALADDRHKFALAIEKKNEEAAMQSWRKVPFPERRYERLSDDVVCAGLSAVDERIASYELRTNLPDSFVGLSYKYNDTGQSEAWMKSVVDETGSTSNSEQAAALAMAADDGVIRAQVATTMQHLLIGVQDRVLTESGILRENELRSANWIESSQNETEQNCHGSEKQPNVESSGSETPEVVEQPVWGIDCYTRRNIVHCLETEFDLNTALVFIEKWLLPAINACPEEVAHDITNAALILEGKPFQDPRQPESETEDRQLPVRHDAPLLRALVEKIRTVGPPWLQVAANQLRRARKALGPDFFRVHPKGHGSVLLKPVQANTLVTFYRGELYPSWRWGEKMDAIDITQRRKNLKPALPDFYNMCLERPQSDPRGYGILFVDASRKAGHGSALSHSCAPTCEVRVAAVNGVLCLAMTTLRELEMGEELTFDYNAVTESLNEYTSAVCLCGYGKCRGSFLHFATADCYQQVLNRNAPIASRFASLVKGSMKQVMSEDDERVIRSHGFLTAAFGAISVNRRQESAAGESENLEDSIDYVPVWLRTFVADTLRYIEYERRALPIALICDHLSNANEDEGKPDTEHVADRFPKEPAKPEPSFFYFARTQSEFFLSLLKKEGLPDSVTGLHLKQAMQKVASGYWQALPDEKKQYWKDQSLAHFEKKRKLWRAQHAKASKNQPSGKAGKPQMGGKTAKKGKTKSKPEISDVLLSSTISFQDADAEGVSATEQRIQQLTQSLSRVGRVLDRHREDSFQQDPSLGHDREGYASSLRKRVHSPIAVASDEQIIGWMWNSQVGVVAKLLDSARTSRCARPCLHEKLQGIRAEYSDLEAFGNPTDDASVGSDRPKISAVDARRLLTEALCKFRTILIDEVQDMHKIFRNYRSLILRQESAKEQEDDTENDAEEESVEISEDSDAQTSSTTETDVTVVSSIMEDLIRQVERRVGNEQTCATMRNEPASDTRPARASMTAQTLIAEHPWLEHYKERFALLAAADLLSFYAHTSNYFLMQPYGALTSTPVEVYARELGNSVPRSAMDSAPKQETAAAPVSPLQKDGSTVTNCKPMESDVPSQKSSALADGFCEPDDIMANVSISYNGDYVLSQLLQWYNGGISQKTGLPDMLGCILLPDMAACWSSSLLSESNKKAEIRTTTYEGKVRPQLIEWLQDPYKRGSPWPEEIQKAFVAKDDNKLETDTSQLWLPFGSPIIDFLVTGDESNITAVLSELDADDKVSAKKDADGLLLSVDKGRPAQAVSNWVQCENPDCLKWRKIPWHVDIDLLPEKFFCKNNKWNPDVNFCGAPEEDWDDKDKLVGDDGKVEGSPVKKDPKAVLNPMEEANMYIGARFDVLRKKKYTIGTVTKIDLSGNPKRVMFHFQKTRAEADEWIVFGSPRIAALYSKVPKGKIKATAKQQTLPENAQPAPVLSKNGATKKKGGKKAKFAVAPGGETVHASASSIFGENAANNHVKPQAEAERDSDQNAACVNHDKPEAKANHDRDCVQIAACNHPKPDSKADRDSIHAVYNHTKPATKADRVQSIPVDKSGSQCFSSVSTMPAHLTQPQCFSSVSTMPAHLTQPQDQDARAEAHGGDNGRPSVTFFHAQSQTEAPLWNGFATTHSQHISQDFNDTPSRYESSLQTLELLRKSAQRAQVQGHLLANYALETARRTPAQTTSRSEDYLRQSGLQAEQFYANFEAIQSQSSSYLPAGQPGSFAAAPTPSQNLIRSAPADALSLLAMASAEALRSNSVGYGFGGQSESPLGYNQANLLGNSFSFNSADGFEAHSAAADNNSALLQAMARLHPPQFNHGAQDETRNYPYYRK